MVEILLNPRSTFLFYAPALLWDELNRYESRLLNLSKLSISNLNEAAGLIKEQVTTISEDLISEAAWQKAYEYTRDVDEDDTPFVALTIELQARMWTGDKKLVEGMKGKGVDLFVTTTQLSSYQ